MISELRDKERFGGSSAHMSEAKQQSRSSREARASAAANTL